MKRNIRIYRTVLFGFMLMAIVGTAYLSKDLFIDDADDKWTVDSRGVDDVLSNVDKVIPLGIQVGVYLETEGVLVANVSEVTGNDGVKYSPADDKVHPGDYIIKFNGKVVSSKSQLLFLINKYGNEDIVLTLKRNDETFDVKITPIKTNEAEYKIGIWVRDDTQGIGTMTFMTEDGYFGALGHGICDVDTSELLDSNSGLLYVADIWSIKKGEKGVPGSLCGSISYEEKMELGEIYSNTNKGIFGRIYKDKVDDIKEDNKLKEYPIGLSKDIHEGNASILCAISGKVEEYDIEILTINNDNENNKGMVLKVLDSELLELTNGIVQGMSGSPIIQDGKIIGAVTHVFVNEPTKGYGIFIENMLER